MPISIDIRRIKDGTNRQIFVVHQTIPIQAIGLIKLFH